VIRRKHSNISNKQRQERDRKPSWACQYSTGGGETKRDLNNNKKDPFCLSINPTHPSKTLKRRKQNSN